MTGQVEVITQPEQAKSKTDLVAELHELIAMQPPSPEQHYAYIMWLLETYLPARAAFIERLMQEFNNNELRALRGMIKNIIGDESAFEFDNHGTEGWR
jgi:hypothetical protein